MKANDKSIYKSCDCHKCWDKKEEMRVNLPKNISTPAQMKMLESEGWVW